MKQPKVLPDRQFPAVPKELMEELRRRYPIKLPSLTTPDREIWAAVGEQNVIALLEREFAKQTNPSK